MENKKPKVCAYYILHYGCEYLEASIISIRDFVDKIVILYTEKPSQGFGTDIVCPETEDQLKAIALRTSDKIEWHKVVVANEGEHRHMAERMAKDYDLLLAVDADEVWDAEALQKCLDRAYVMDHRYMGVTGFLNFWKSFNRYCKDFFAPVRITNLNRWGNLHTESFEGKVYHFSTAQSRRMVDYKWAISGHHNELRKDWFSIYDGWSEENQIRFLHPTSLDIWGEALPFDRNAMPEVLKNHPNFNKETIT